MDREVKNSYRQCLAEVGGILAPSARTGLADLAPGVKVVQTVVCSTFTPGAPAVLLTMESPSST
jgi:hypothetical protein